MALVAAKCTQCGAKLTVDDSKEAGICENCGTAFITEKVVTNFITNNNTTINQKTVNIYQGGKTDKIGEELEEINDLFQVDMQEAEYRLGQLTITKKGNFRVWFYILKYLTYDFGEKINDDNEYLTAYISLRSYNEETQHATEYFVDEVYENCKKLAKGDDKILLEVSYKKYEDAFNNYFEKLRLDKINEKKEKYLLDLHIKSPTNLDKLEEMRKQQKLSEKDFYNIRLTICSLIKNNLKDANALLELRNYFLTDDKGGFVAFYNENASLYVFIGNSYTYEIYSVPIKYFRFDFSTRITPYVSTISEEKNGISYCNKILVKLYYNFNNDIVIIPDDEITLGSEEYKKLYKLAHNIAMAIDSYAYEIYSGFKEADNLDHLNKKTFVPRGYALIKEDTLYADITEQELLKARKTNNANYKPIEDSSNNNILANSSKKNLLDGLGNLASNFKTNHPIISFLLNASLYFLILLLTFVLLAIPVLKNNGTYILTPEQQEQVIYYVIADVVLVLILGLKIAIKVRRRKKEKNK